VPTVIADITHIPMKKVAAGGFSGSISMDSGDLYLWGSGVFGEFLTPHRVKTIHGSTVDVSIGNHFGTAINKSGGIYTWGINNSGELG
jgi:X-linked retinitis pigmentosa GTPase regulator